MKVLDFLHKRQPSKVYVVEMSTHLAGVLPTLEAAMAFWPEDDWVEGWHGDMRRWFNGKMAGDVNGVWITEWIVE